jgi:hypothetical protein
MFKMIKSMKYMIVPTISLIVIGLTIYWLYTRKTYEGLTHKSSDALKKKILEYEWKYFDEKTIITLTKMVNTYDTTASNLKIVFTQIKDLDNALYRVVKQGKLVGNIKQVVKTLDKSKLKAAANNLGITDEGFDGIMELSTKTAMLLPHLNINDHIMQGGIQVLSGNPVFETVISQIQQYGVQCNKSELDRSPFVKC